MGVSILGADGRPYDLANRLEDPRFSLDDPETWKAIGVGVESDAGVPVTPKSALGYPPLWRAVNLIANDVGRLPFDTFERVGDDGRRKARGHSARKLLRKPSPVMTGRRFRRTLTFHALIYGNGVAAIFRDGRGLREMLILDPRQTCLAVVDGELWYVTYIDGEPRRLRHSDVFHVRGLSHDGMWGLDVLDLMRDALGLPLAARRFASKFFANGSNVGGLLMVPGHFTDEKIANTIGAWNKMQTGLTKAHRVALLQEGAKFEKLTVEPEKSQLVEMQRAEIVTVANIMGVPPSRLGADVNTSYKSLESERQAYLDDGLDPWLVEWEEEADDKLLTPEERDRETHYHEFLRDRILAMDTKARNEGFKLLKEIGVLNTNDILRKLNMPTIGAVGDKRYRPANWMEEGAAADGGNADVRAAHRRLIVDRVKRMCRLEASKIRDASSRAGFVDWLPTFYGQHAPRMLEALAPAVAAAWALAGRLAEGDRVVRAAVSRYCEDSFAVLRGLGVTGPDDLAERVSALVDPWWRVRGSVLVDELLPRDEPRQPEPEETETESDRREPAEGE